MSAKTYRPGLEAPPPNIARLPVDPDRKYPIPFFVAWLNGKPEFRFSDPLKLSRCVVERLCWVCGQKLGLRFTFVSGPMCCINRISSEPPSHPECARYSARNCPFLVKPAMVRRDDELFEKFKHNVAGTMSERNPGVFALWHTSGYRVVSDPKGRALFEVSDPTRIEWFTEGRKATRDEIDKAIAASLTILEAEAGDNAKAIAFLEEGKRKLMALLPPRE